MASLPEEGEDGAESSHSLPLGEPSAPRPQVLTPPPDTSADAFAAAEPVDFAEHPAADGIDGAHGSSGRASQTSSILKLKGLPYATTEEQVFEFFQEYEILTVHFVYEPDGRPSGLAFAEFGSKEEAMKALSRDGEFIGERYVRLLHVPASEMEEQVRLGTLAIPGNAAKLRSRLMRQEQQRNQMTYLGTMQLIPTIMPGHGARPQFMNMNMTPALGHHMAGQMQMDGHVWPGGYAATPQNPAAAAALAAQFHGLSLGMQRGGGGGLPHMLPPHPHPHPHPMQSPASATLKVRGLPYRSSPAEILAFFQGYQYLPDSLQIGLDSLGRPSGEAWLTFVNPPEALRAVRDLNRHFLGKRYLELSIC